MFYRPIRRGDRSCQRGRWRSFLVWDGGYISVASLRGQFDGRPILLAAVLCLFCVWCRIGCRGAVRDRSDQRGLHRCGRGRGGSCQRGGRRSVLVVAERPISALVAVVACSTEKLPREFWPPLGISSEIPGVGWPPLGKTSEIRMVETCGISCEILKGGQACGRRLSNGEEFQAFRATIRGSTFRGGF